MAIRAIIFRDDNDLPILQPFYFAEVQRGTLDIVGYAFEENGKINVVNSRDDVDPRQFDIAIISSRKNFYARMKLLEGIGMPREKIIDGFVFHVPNLNLPALIDEGIAYGVFENQYSFTDYTNVNYTRVYKFLTNDAILTLGRKARINLDNAIESNGVNQISFGNFSRISWKSLIELGLNCTHNHRNVSVAAIHDWDWDMPLENYYSDEPCKIEIGNDVWIGRGCILKCSNPKKPLVIGDGAVVASDSVVVKNIPPYAIVGGNPAQIIKYRFPQKIIEGLLRIKWWDWDIDKIHDNFKYFTRVEEFVEMHDVSG